MVRFCMIGLTFLFGLRLAEAEDFRKSYPLVSGGQIFIQNFLGDIRIKSYKGDKIEIVGIKNGDAGDKIEILDNSMQHRINISLRPLQFPAGNARVDFEVRVPKSVEYNFTRISSFSGDVDISGVVGQVSAESVRGNIRLKDVKGVVSASSFSGNINVMIGKTQDRNNMRFSTISGNIDVSAPVDLNALVDISSSSGLLKTDFPLEVQEFRYGPARSARGRLGTGIQVLRIRSVTGRINLVQR